MIDLVLPYVDCSKPEWQSTYLSFCLKNNIVTKIPKERFRSWDNLRYLLRSVDQFTNIDRIFLLVSDKSQVPDWITNVVVVEHKDFIPKKFLPTFNSTTIEMFLHRIPNLSEYFVYANDDFFFTNTANDFFTEDGKPKVHIYLKERKLNSQFRKVEFNTQSLFLDPPSGKSYKINHTFTPMRKSILNKVYKENRKKILDSITPVRHVKNFNQYIYTFYALANNLLEVLPEPTGKYFSVKDETLPKITSAIRSQEYTSVCVNDVSDSVDFNKAKEEIINAFHDILPTQCRFENYSEDFKVDYVFPYVDCNTQSWQTRYLKFCKDNGITPKIDRLRYEPWDTMSFIKKSIRKFAPWINNIFVITPNKEDIKDPDLIVVEDKDIVPKEFLPTFNSTTIEMFLHRIPNLSEHFIYGNDDMVFTNYVSLSDYFTKDGLPKLRFKQVHFNKKEPYRHHLKNGQNLVDELLELPKDNPDTLYQPSHSPIPYRKSVYKNIVENVPRTSFSPMRSFSNINHHVVDFYEFRTNPHPSERRELYLFPKNEDSLKKFEHIHNYQTLCINGAYEQIEEEAKKKLNQTLKEIIDVE